MEVTFLFVAMVTFIITLQAPSNVIITVLSSLLHEMGHLSAMCISGNKPEEVRLEITGITIRRAQSIKVSIKNELLIALGGPLVNGLVFLLFCLLYCCWEKDFFITVAGINLILMTFNMLPVRGLDGGMALYFFLCKGLSVNLCNKILKITSWIFILLIFSWGVYVFISSEYNFSVIIIAIFLTLSTFSGNEY